MASGLASDRRADLGRFFLGWSCDLQHTQAHSRWPRVSAGPEVCSEFARSTGGRAAQTLASPQRRQAGDSKQDTQFQ